MWKRIAALARQQLGYVTRQQLLGLGLSSAAIGRLAKSGRLISVHRGVYAVGHAPSNPVNQANAAVIACGDGAGLSGGSALDLYGWLGRGYWRTPFEVTVPKDRRIRTVRIHIAVLAPRDLSTHLGVRVTSPARTVLDNAPRLRPRARARMVNQARVAGHLEIRALDDVVARNPRHPGATLLLPYLDDPGNPTRSGWERDFPAWCERYGLPRPVMDEVVHGVELDAWFPIERVAVELDSWFFHRDKARFQRDRDKGNLLAVHGIPLLRITDDAYAQGPDHLANQLQRLLEMRRAA